MINKKLLSHLLCFSLLGSMFTSSLPVHAKTIVNINLGNVKQEIDGFGVSQAAWSDAIYNLSEPARSEVLDLLFSQEGIDLDILRGEIFPEFAPAPGVYDFTKRQDQAWVMQEAKTRGVEKFVATTWSPPAWMKTNNQTTNGGYLKSEHYSNYADLMAQFVKSYSTLYDIDLYAVSMCNEPNSMTFLSWNSCEWNGDQIKNFLANYLKPEFEAEGLNRVKVIAAEPSWWKEDLMKPALNDSTASSRLDIVAAHNYTIPILNTKQPQTPFDVARSKGKKVWMSEVSSPETYDPNISSGITLAKEMHTFMTTVNANAYLYWTGAIPGNNDEGLINVDFASNTYKLTKRFYTFGNFSKFIKPGYNRVDATSNPTSGVYTSAYTDPSRSKVIVVAINDSNTTKEITLTANDFNTYSLTPYITNDTYGLEAITPITSTTNTFDVTLPPQSVITYVGQLDDTPIPIVETFYDDLSTWNNVYAHTTGAAIDLSSPNKFSGDTARVKRTTEDTESIVFNVNNMESFQSTFYHNAQWDGVAFYSSGDGVNWTLVPHVSTAGKLVSIGWYQKVYSSIPLLTTNNNYLKIELSGPGAWNKQIGDVTIKYRAK